MAWTAERVAKLLDDVQALHACRSRRETDALDKCQRLEMENAELRAELAGVAGKHQAAMRGVIEKGQKMEALMRQLLDERARLADEVAALRPMCAARQEAGQTISHAVQTESADLQTKSADLQTKSAAVQTEAAAVQTEAAAVQTKSADLQTKSATVQTEAAAVQTKSADLQTKSAAVQTKAAAVQTEVAAVQTESATVQTKSADLQTKSATVQTEAAAVQMKSATVQTESADLQTKSAAVQKEAAAVLSAAHPPAAYAYGLVPAARVRYAAGSERLALSLFLIGRQLSRVRLDARGEIVFCALSVRGWWEWRRQPPDALARAVCAAAAVSSGDSEHPLWWAAVLGAALLDFSENVSAAEMISAACGCCSAAPVALTRAALREFATETFYSACIVLLRHRDGDEAAIVGATFVTRRQGEKAEAEEMEVKEEEGQRLLFRVVRPASGELVAEWWTVRQLLDAFALFRVVDFGAEGVELRVPCTVSAHSASVALALSPPPPPPLRSAVRAALCDAQRDDAAPLELRETPRGPPPPQPPLGPQPPQPPLGPQPPQPPLGPQPPQPPQPSQPSQPPRGPPPPQPPLGPQPPQPSQASQPPLGPQPPQPPLAPLGRLAPQPSQASQPPLDPGGPGALRAVARAVAGGSGCFALRCAALRESAAAVAVLRVPAAAGVRRIDFTDAESGAPLTVVAQVDAQEICANHIVLNVEAEREAQSVAAVQSAKAMDSFAQYCLRTAAHMADASNMRAQLFVHCAIAPKPLKSMHFAFAAGAWAVARASLAQSYAATSVGVLADIYEVQGRMDAAELGTLREDLGQCAEAFEVMRHAMTIKNAQLKESRRYCCLMDAELEKSNSAIAEMRAVINEKCGENVWARGKIERDFT